jgi:hypothetical protein
MNAFALALSSLSWWNETADDPRDLCLHGKVAGYIGDKTISCTATVSAAALNLLRTLTEEHRAGEKLQMLPCCGFALFADETGENVTVIGCNQGVDWTVLHEDGMVRMVLEGESVTVPMDEYRAVVCRFADTVEAFYESCVPKILPENEIDRRGYEAFWREFHRRRDR